MDLVVIGIIQTQYACYHSYRSENDFGMELYYIYVYANVVKNIFQRYNITFNNISHGA